MKKRMFLKNQVSMLNEIRGAMVFGDKHEGYTFNFKKCGM